MTFATIPTHTVATGKLTFANISIPVRLYKGVTEIELAGNTFHDGCPNSPNGRVRQTTHCESCGLEYPPTYSAVPVGTIFVRLSREIRKELLGGDCDFSVVSSHPINSLPPLMAENSVVACGQYQLAPERFNERAFSTLLSRLRVKKTFLLLTAPIGNTKRFAILLPNGALIALLYEEEIRPHRFEESDTDRDIARAIDQGIAEIKSEFPKLSAKPILRRVENYIAHIVSRKTVSAIPKKEKVKVK